MTTQTLYGYRYVQVQDQDTLQDIAARELGDASQWVKVAWINGLSWPYLTGDATAAGPTCALYGAKIMVPAPTVQLSSASDTERVFGTDLLLKNGFLRADNGDIALVAGIDNLRQAVYNRFQTPLYSLTFHQAYGYGGYAVIGNTDTPTSALVAASYAKDALLNDPRFQSVPLCTAKITGDTIAISAQGMTVSGTSIDLSSEVTA